MGSSAGSKSVKNIRRAGSAAVVELCGEIDLHRTPGVHKALTEVVQSKPNRLIINLSDVSYIDSSGIGTLVEIFRRVNGYDGELRLCGMNNRVHSVFEITKLDQFFTIVETEAEALAE